MALKNNAENTHEPPLDLSPVAYIQRRGDIKVDFTPEKNSTGQPTAQIGRGFFSYEPFIPSVILSERESLRDYVVANYSYRTVRMGLKRSTRQDDGLVGDRSGVRPGGLFPQILSHT